jgi:hypothetical protein
MKVVLYTVHCPKCKILEKKLEQSKIKYDVCEDLDLMLAKGFQTAPVLDVDGKIMEFKEAVQWVKEQIGG